MIFLYIIRTCLQFGISCIRYDIMLSCWCVEPEKRPTFKQLERSISGFLGKSEADHYINLNEANVQANEAHLNSGQTDYLTLMAVPDCRTPLPMFQTNSSSDVNSATNPSYVTSASTLHSATNDRRHKEIQIAETCV